MRIGRENNPPVTLFGPDGNLYVGSQFNGKILLFPNLTKNCQENEIFIDNNCVKNPFPGGECLIATATYGSELAPQIQQLRELRDNKILQTKLGTNFMNSFHEFYYSFSPYVSDLERQNPMFKETVKILITPLISSLSLLNHTSLDSETEILGYGISLIILNLSLYLTPIYGIVLIKKLII